MMSRTLKEEVGFDRGMVTDLDWASDPILTFPEVPEIVIELNDHPIEPPRDAGVAAAVSSSIANAVFDTMDVQFRSVPFAPEKVKRPSNLGEHHGAGDVWRRGDRENPDDGHYERHVPT